MKWKKPKNNCIFLIILVFCNFVVTAQSIYTDYKPQYREWRYNYIIDKIQYNANEIIFFFRCYSIYNNTIVDFWLHHPKQYCLENVDNPDETFYATDIKNIRVGGALKCTSMNAQNKTDFRTVIPANVTITCEVYFPRIPNHISRVHFLEGKKYRELSNHFHAFEVKMKQWDDKDLGTPQDRLDRIVVFERTNFHPHTPNIERKIWYQPDLNKNLQYNKEAKIRM